MNIIFCIAQWLCRTAMEGPRAGLAATGAVPSPSRRSCPPATSPEKALPSLRGSRGWGALGAAVPGDLRGAAGWCSSASAPIPAPDPQSSSPAARREKPAGSSLNLLRAAGGWGVTAGLAGRAPAGLRTVGATRRHSERKPAAGSSGSSVCGTSSWLIPWCIPMAHPVVHPRRSSHGTSPWRIRMAHPRRSSRSTSAWLIPWLIPMAHPCGTPCGTSPWIIPWHIPMACPVAHLPSPAQAALLPGHGQGCRGSAGVRGEE